MFSYGLNVSFLLCFMKYLLLQVKNDKKIGHVMPYGNFKEMKSISSLKNSGVVVSFNSIIVLFFMMKWNRRENIEWKRGRVEEGKFWWSNGFTSFLASWDIFTGRITCTWNRMLPRDTLPTGATNYGSVISAFNATLENKGIYESPTLHCGNTQWHKCYYRFNNDITSCTRDR